MKKNNYRQLKKVAHLLLCFLFFYACQEQDIIVEQEVQSKYILTKVNTKEINNNVFLADKLIRFNNTQKSTNTNNGRYEGVQFNLNTNEATYIENVEEGYHSYTFEIYNYEDNFNLNNIVLVSYDGGQNYEAFLTTYILTEDERAQLSNGIALDLSGKTIIEPFNLDQINTYSKTAGGSCYDLVATGIYLNCTCHVGDHAPGGCEHPTQVFVWVEEPCPGDSTGGGSGSGGTSGGGGGSSGSGDLGSGDNGSGDTDSSGSTDTPGSDNVDEGKIPTTPQFSDGSSAAASFLIGAIGEDNLTQSQIDWINNDSDPDTNSQLISIIKGNGSSMGTIDFVIESIDRLAEKLVTINEIVLTGTTIFTDVPWTPHIGEYNGLPSLAYTHSRTIISNGRTHFQYLLANGDVLSVSSYPRDEYSSELTPVLFYFNQQTQLWYDYQEPSSYEPLTLDFLWDGFWSTTATAVRVFTPIEDIIILIEGKDFEGVEQSRAVAGTFILLDVIPGSSVLKTLKMVKYGDDIIQLGEAVVKIVDDIYKSQKQTIKNVLDGIIDLDEFGNTIRKGNFGEMVTDEDLYSKGYDALHIRRTDIDQPLDTGIDGVFKNPETGEFIVVESKYNTSQLGTLADGTRQMSEEWIEDRLVNEVGGELAEEILDEGFTSVIARILPDGSLTYKKLNNLGYVIGTWTP